MGGEIMSIWNIGMMEQLGGDKLLPERHSPMIG